MIKLTSIYFSMGEFNMISHRSHTKDWIFQIRKQIPKSDPILIEKMIMALYLVEQLQLSGLEFI